MPFAAQDKPALRKRAVSRVTQTDEREPKLLLVASELLLLITNDARFSPFGSSSMAMKRGASPVK